MEGGRHRFTCAACGRGFTYWVQTTDPHPKVICYYCGKELFPKGEPPAQPAPAAGAAAPAPKPAAEPPKT